MGNYFLSHLPHPHTPPRHQAPSIGPWCDRVHHSSRKGGLHSQASRVAVVD